MVLFLAFSSCEKVIELDLDDAEPRLVIEGFVTDQPGPYTIKISQSGRFYDANDFPLQSGASVVISDENGNVDELTEVSTGIYQTTTLQGQRGVTYTLDVALNGKNYTTSSQMPAQQITLDSLLVTFEEESIFYKEGFYMTAYFNDPLDIENYYRLNVLVNGEVYVFGADDEDSDFIYVDDNFWLANDKFTDGNIQDFEFPHTLKEGDSIYVEMHHINRSTFDYYRTLVDIIDGAGVAPSNPISNFGDQALGYFGAFSVTANSVIVK